MTPTGLPAWVRAMSHEDYGGHLEKRNFQSQGVVNPRTDVGAEALCRMAADLEAAARTAPWCVLRMTVDTVAGDVTVQSVNQMTGTRSAPYDGTQPPGGFPSVAINGAGDVTVTWDAEYPDAYGVTAPVNITHAIASIGGNAAAFAAWEAVDGDADGSAEAVRAYAFDATGTPLDDFELTLTVHTGPGV